MGYEEYFYSKAFCLIEWPEKIGELLPLVHEKVTISLQGEQRAISY
jgi:tRNA threonylcarbamoyladenosine biosynthesis protein TsaE